MQRVPVAAALALLAVAACDPASPTAPADAPMSAIVLSALTIEPTRVQLNVGETATFTVRLYDVPITGIQWSISDSRVATISSGGKVTALAAGTAIVTAGSNSGSITARVDVNRPTTAVWRPPQLPRAFVDTRLVAPTGRLIRVASGGNLQAAIDAAQPGDVVELAAGATFRGAFTLPPKVGSGWITIRSSAHGQLREGVRVRPRDAPRMARLQGGQRNRRVLATRPGARNWRLVGLEIALAPHELPALVNTVVELVEGSSHIIIDRSYIHGSPLQGLQRCLVMNSGTTAVIDSWLDECHAKGFDSQAIVGWSGPGPYKIVNNYLAGAGENIMFGGASVGSGHVPADIEIRRNHIVKPLSWQGAWTVKNAFELKIAERVLFEGNVIENVWADAQVGFAIVLKSENRDAETRPDLATRDVTIRSNRIINARFGVSVIGGASSDSRTGEGRTERVLFENNSFGLYDVRAFQFGTDLDDIGVVRNTLSESGRTLIEGDGGLLLFTGNLGGMVKGSGVREGEPTFDRFDEYQVVANAFVGRPAASYPGNNFFPSTFAQAPASTGADQARLDAATAGVRQ